MLISPSIKRLSIVSALSLPAVALLSSTGCEQHISTDTPRTFEPNYVYAKVMAVREDVETEPFLKDVNRLMEEWFGTPDAPKLPPLFEKEESLKDLVSLTNLQMAAGPAPLTAEAGETGLFRQQCATCHGETGQGRGVVAASQNPYPRDFRRGIYKYKTTSRSSKPTKDDLRHILVHGLEGTQMPRFEKLSEKQLNAIIDYIVYLSIRGELERQLLTNAAYDIDPGTPLYDKSKIVTKTDDSEDAYTQDVYDEQLSDAEDELLDIAESWVDAADEVEEPTEPETTFVVGISGDEVDTEALAASIQRGKELFATETAACAKCHGPTGNGIGQQIPDYDDWTKEWTTAINVDPKNRDEQLPFLVSGALPPQPLMPRNLIEGKLRGGREAAAVYHRIVHGIAGSPMPAATLKQSADGPGLSNDEIWDIVNYVLSLRVEPTSPTSPEVAIK